LCEAGIPHAFDHYIFPEYRRWWPNVSAVFHLDYGVV
jgi:hypothetical protein